jgi:hypothetical protein
VPYGERREGLFLPRFVVACGLLRESDFDALTGAYDALITSRARPDDGVHHHLHHLHHLHH